MRLTAPLICVALASAMTPCWATLGGNASSVAADSAHLKGALRSTSGPAYTIHEISTPTSTVIREYVGSDGTVFAVSWHGPFNPDLRQMFGTYYAEYVRAAAPLVGRDRRHSRVETANLVVQRSGRLRGYYGRAYLPQRLPANVNPADIE
ncbi:MAG: DUF2844 domain-containing protein [Gammaproteobacteria bacterium]|nr:DUF2844 domain-containing protein [Gammaproteobacteria bacterium]MBV9619662.1 DUF2844 domain-containing protein [Gammaproteobacteria bacterium]